MANQASSSSATVRVEPAIMWRGLKSVRVGTVAAFGVADEVVTDLQASLKRYTAVGTQFIFTRMGEDIPYHTVNHENDLYLPPTLILNYRVRARAERFFFIIELHAQDAGTNQPTYGFVNIRLDRLANLLRFKTNQELFNLHDYATLVAHGLDQPTDEVWRKMEVDYLFGRHQVNVRLFPRLNEVT